MFEHRPEPYNKLSWSFNITSDITGIMKIKITHHFKDYSVSRLPNMRVTVKIFISAILHIKM